MKRILITGITGFIGTNLLRFFSGVPDVTVFGHSRSSAKAKAAFEKDGVKCIEHLTADELDANGIDTVIHLAGIAHDLSGNYRPEDYHRVNFLNTAELYDEFTKSNAVRFFFVSSIKAVIDSSRLAVNEEVEAKPASPYGISKLEAEKYIVSRELPPGKRYYIFRPCLIHGPGNKGNLKLLYKFVSNGIPYPLGAFENQRSYLSIENLVFIIDRFIAGHPRSGVFNLADNGTLSTKELIAIIAGAMGKKPRILDLPKNLVVMLARAGTFFRLPFNTLRLGKLTENMIVSNAKLIEILGTPLPVTLREGLSKTVKSFHDQP
jgi:nucleoside-diphosphate-sugar epimerase